MWGELSLRCTTGCHCSVLPPGYPRHAFIGAAERGARQMAVHRRVRHLDSIRGIRFDPLRGQAALHPANAHMCKGSARRRTGAPSLPRHSLPPLPAPSPAPSLCPAKIGNNGTKER